MPAGRTLIPAVILIGIVVVLYATAPKSEDFWWTDAPSFALNGELIHDYVASGFHQSPMAFANEWFRRYPAISISLYPPIFPIVEAVAFGLFGFSHPVAQATVAAFAGLAAFGCYRLARTAGSPLEATGGVLLMFATPIMLLWSRQVMMEVPELAFLLLACGSFLRYQADRRTRDLMLATLMALCAIYTKQTAIFVAPVFAVALVAGDGWRRLGQRDVLIAAAAGILGIVPLVVFTLKTAPENFQIAVGHGMAAQPGQVSQSNGRFALAFDYFLALPEIVGWPLLVASICYVGFTVIRGWRNPAERRLAILMLTWFGCNFLFISVTAHFEPRYAIHLGLPCAILTLLLISRLIHHPLRSWIVLAAGLVLFTISLGTQPVYRMSGYDKVAAYILEHSNQNDVVWFQGKQSKNLIFSMRTRSPMPKLFVLRAEKFLVDYEMTTVWNMTDRGWTADKLRDLVDRYGISLVVLQPDFGDDMPSMNRMRDYIDSDRFKQVAEFPITADDPSQRSTIKVFVNQRPTVAAEHPADRM